MKQLHLGMDDVPAGRSAALYETAVPCSEAFTKFLQYLVMGDCLTNHRGG